MDDLQYIANMENQMAAIQLGPYHRFDNIDAFDVLSERDFTQLFRLSKELCRFLIQTVEPHNMRPQRRNTDLSTATRVRVNLFVSMY